MILASVIDQLLGLMCLGVFALTALGTLAAVWAVRFLKQHPDARTAAGEIARNTAAQVLKRVFKV